MKDDNEWLSQQFKMLFSLKPCQSIFLSFLPFLQKKMKIIFITSKLKAPDVILGLVNFLFLRKVSLDLFFFEVKTLEVFFFFGKFNKSER